MKALYTKWGKSNFIHCQRLYSTESLVSITLWKLNKIKTSKHQKKIDSQGIVFHLFDSFHIHKQCTLCYCKKPTMTRLPLQYPRQIAHLQRKTCSVSLIR
eukprot:TRINITY_DN4607_c0_g6_i1.p1 TRINITY_DN4607_c0_g6~~TRINITY_DN4607_c0_g6_i1.p1  ORF type:complete len:100 (-),score=8.34 TRINITY_DN4607_c0_g6_i1:3-302(-)